MADTTFRLQAKRVADGAVLVKALIRHPNHNGLGRTADGEPIPPHHLTEVVVAVNGEPVVTLHTGSGIAVMLTLAATWPVAPIRRSACGWTVRCRCGPKWRAVT